MNDLIFDETPNDPKNVRLGKYVKNWQMRSAQVLSILSTDLNHKGTYTGNDTIIVCRPEKFQFKC